MEKEKNKSITTKELPKIEDKKTEVKQKVKLTFNDKRDYTNLPKEIEELEKKIEELTTCSMNPVCYEEKGLLVVTKELDESTKLYEAKVERFLELEEIVEGF